MPSVVSGVPKQIKKTGRQKSEWYVWVMSVIDKLTWRNFQRNCGVFGLDTIHNHSKRLAGDTYACCWWGRNLTLIECKGKTGARCPHSRTGLQASAPSFTGKHSSCCLFEISLNLQWFRNHSKWWERSKPVICSLSGLGKKKKKGKKVHWEWVTRHR